MRSRKVVRLVALDLRLQQVRVRSAYSRRRALWKEEGRNEKAPLIRLTVKWCEQVMSPAAH